MGKVLKSHWTSSAAFVAAAALVCGPVWAAGMNNTIPGVTQSAVQKVEKVKPLQCLPAQYSDPGQMKACNECKAAVNNWKSEIPKEVKKNGATDAGVTAANSTTLSKGVDAYSKGTGQAAGENTGRDTSKSGQGALTQREGLGRNMAGVFGKCESDMESKCSSVQGQDRDSASEMRDACSEGKNASNKFADQQKQGAGGMGDMSKMMDMASKAMQAMQAMQQQPEASDVSQPPAAAAEQSYETQVSSMGGKSGSNAPVGFGSADGKSVENELAAVEGGGSGVSGSSTSFRPDDSSSSDMGGPVAASTMGVSGGGGSGAGAGNSSGSSRPAEAMEAAASYNNGGAFEMNMGGGTRMMGLKPSRTDLEAMGGEVTPSEAGALAEGEGDGRGLASEETAGANEEATQDGDSVFARVRFKYSVLKGAGRI